MSWPRCVAFCCDAILERAPIDDGFVGAAVTIDEPASERRQGAVVSCRLPRGQLGLAAAIFWVFPQCFPFSFQRCPTTGARSSRFCFRAFAWLSFPWAIADPQSGPVGFEGVDAFEVPRILCGRRSRGRQDAPRLRPGCISRCKTRFRALTAGSAAAQHNTER